MKEISSNAVHNFTIRLRAVSEFIDSMSVSEVRYVMETPLSLHLSKWDDIKIITKRAYSFNNDKDEINFKIWFLNLMKIMCPPDMSADTSLEMTWCRLLLACKLI